MFSNTCAMTLAQKSDRILAQTRGLSGATPNATQLIEALRWALDAYKQEAERLCNERDKMAHQLDEYRESFANMARERDLLWEDLERVTKERDEARRMACEALAAGDDDEASEYARLRNWDCFAHTDGASSPEIPDNSREAP